MSKKVLLAGESWMSYTTHVKGFDAFYTSTYETGEKWLKAALEAGGYEVILPFRTIWQMRNFHLQWKN